MPDYSKKICDDDVLAWERVKTTRRYLHCPKAERMYTLWAEGKVVMGENNWYPSHLEYHTLDAYVIWPSYYKNDRMFDYKKAENYVPFDGVPVHGVRFKTGGFVVEEEAFSDISAKPTCFIRIRYRNTAPYTSVETFGFLLRKGKEKEIIYGSPDIYTTYLPEISAVKAMPEKFVFSEGVYRCGDVFVKIISDNPVTYDETAGAIHTEMTLGPGQYKDVILAFGKGDVPEFTYEEELQKTIDWWTRKIGQMRPLPPAVMARPELVRMIKNLVVQMHQCLCYYIGRDYYVFRQGGLQRHIWPWDAMPALEALGRLGGFDAELEEVFSTYYNQMWQPDGKIDNFGIVWAADTACCLYSLSTYCLQRGEKAFYEKYRDKALASFEWIEKTRHESGRMPGCVEGLFPPLRANDWTEVFQHWMFTDALNLNGGRAFVKAARFFGDPAANELEAKWNGYLEDYRRAFCSVVDVNGNGPVRIPLLLNGDDRKLLDACYSYIQFALPMLQLEGRIPETVLDRVKQWATDVKVIENGLYGRMPRPNGNTHIFYTTASEFNWFKIYLNRKRYDEAREIVRATLKYSISTEDYMVERFDAGDPYFGPWSPNASANGRLINMLLDLAEAGQKELC